jgi:hypothetical protein
MITTTSNLAHAIATLEAYRAERPLADPGPLISAALVAAAIDVIETARHVRELRQHCAELSAALVQYGDHEPGCNAPYWRVTASTEACTCGYWAAMDRLHNGHQLTSDTESQEARARAQDDGIAP